MSRREESEPITKITINIYTEDYHRLQALYAKIGYGAAIRKIVRKHLKDLETRAAKQVEAEAYE